MNERPDLTTDELLSTTRAVRKRLDLERAVPREVVEECLRLAFQAPNGSNRQLWQWVVVDDPDTRGAMADLYREAIGVYVHGLDVPPVDWASPEGERMSASVAHLTEHLHEVPVLVVPAVLGRAGASVVDQSLVWNSIAPATWSFMLALRSRGLGSVWTTVHLALEERMADLLGIPYPAYTQAGLVPVAWTIGTDFRPGPRDDLTEVVHWNRWRG
ncbi:MAG: nitroreductase family protein [Actinomycetes bacterium]